MIDYAGQRRAQRRTSSGKKKFLILFFLFFLLWALNGSITTLFFGKSREEVSVAGESITPEESSLKSIVLSGLANKQGTYGIAIKNLKTNEGFLYNEDKRFESASLYKLWVMSVVYKQIADGKLQEDQELKEDVSVLNEKFHIASESAELTEGTVEFTIHDALAKMITISDNYAALLLTARVRLSTVEEFLKRNGFTESRVSSDDDPPETTASDIALFYELLYRSQLADPESSEKMLSLLRMQRLNEKLPKHLPENTVVAHKTGELGTLSHDAGIVYGPKGDYIIVVLSDTQKPLEANNVIADISKAVYDYFSK